MALESSLAHVQVLRVLEGRILDGTYPVGSRLPSERNLAEEFGVGRNAVREALRVLAERRLISVEQGRGSTVQSADASSAAAAVSDALRRSEVTVREVIDGRTLIEPENARLAAMHRTDEDLADLARHLKEFRPGASVLTQVRADLAFHLAIARASKNLVLETMFRAVSELAGELMIRSITDHDVATRALPQHEEILQAISDRDPERARKLMVEHLTVATRLFGGDLDQPLDAVAIRQLSMLLGDERSARDAVEHLTA